MRNERPNPVGRGSGIRPLSRFDTITRVPLDLVDDDDIEAHRHPATEFVADHSKSVISENDSPDVGFRYSLNPYRGCEHGCSYCYARPTHEYLGYDAGLGFETKIVVKHHAPRLFREFLARDSWLPEPIALSGVTDPYQPCERQFRLTRRCLEVAAGANQPICLVSKSALMLRDLDILGPMAAGNLVHANISITTLDPALRGPWSRVPLHRLGGCGPCASCQPPECPCAFWWRRSFPA